MPTPSSSSIQLILPLEGESFTGIMRRMQETPGELLLVLSGRDGELVQQPDVRKAFFTECKKLHGRLRIATKHPTVAAEARSHGIRVFDRTRQLKAFLTGHPKMDDALRVFSPHLWRQQLKSQMQRMGLLSVPKLRIFFLVGLSTLLFFIVLFKLLPSADIYVKPRQEAVSQTVNIFLVQSGSTADISRRVRNMPLVPLRMTFKKSMTFDHISKEFIGTSSQVELTVINKATERYALRGGTRFTNQAGMVFKILDHAIVDPGQELTVRAKAEDLDLYDQIIGDRGNVPAGLKWEIPGLSIEERKIVYAENRKPATGGTTAYRTVLRKEDLDLARKRLEQELLAAATEMVKEERDMRNALDKLEYLQILNYPELTSIVYQNFSLPEQFIGQIVTSVPVEGEIVYTVFAYDAMEILGMLRTELRAHVREGRRLIDENLGHEHLVAHVIDYADDRSWIKLTVDLTATEEFILDPLSPTGALFGRKVREQVAGTSQEDALRILRNMPEVETIDISQWPPWNRSLPDIASHISIIPF